MTNGETVLGRVLDLQIIGFVDSPLETTRVFWRQKFFKATEEEARDPRPFAKVLASRHSGSAPQ